MLAEMSEIAVMTIITLHHLCVSPRVIVLKHHYFLQACASSKKYLGPKQSPPISYNDLKKDGAQLVS